MCWNLASAEMQKWYSNNFAATTALMLLDIAITKSVSTSNSWTKPFSFIATLHDKFWQKCDADIDRVDAKITFKNFKKREKLWTAFLNSLILLI